MKSVQIIAGDIERLGQFLGMGQRLPYADVHAEAAAASALQRWALLRQLQELQLPTTSPEAGQA